MAWTLLSGGDHETDDWIITSNSTVGGYHYGIGIFRLTGGVTLTIDAESVFRVSCIEAQVLGTIDGDGKGTSLGNISGGAGGTSGSHNGGAGTARDATGPNAGSGGSGYSGGGNGGAGGKGGLVGTNASDATAADCYYGTGTSSGSAGGGGWGEASNGETGDAGIGNADGGGACWIDALRKIYTSAGVITCKGKSGSRPDGGKGGTGTVTGTNVGAGAGGGGGAGGGAGGCILLRGIAVKVSGGSLSVDAGNGGQGGYGGNGGLDVNGDLPEPYYRNPGTGGTGGQGGTGGRIKIATELPESVHLTEPTASYSAGNGGAAGLGGYTGTYSSPTRASSGSSGGLGTAGTYKKRSTGTPKPTWTFDGRLIYQEAGAYLQRMRVNLL